MRTTIILEDSVYEKVKTIIPPRRISQFINRVIKEKIEQIERQRIIEEMKEGYIATRRNRRELNKEWDAILSEDWE